MPTPTERETSMTVTYRFTVRPASSYTCPPGWTDIRPLIPDQQWNYGEVDYPEALDFKVADHYSLVPIAQPRVSIEWDGTSWTLLEIFGENGREMAYRWGCDDLSHESLT